MTRQPSLLFVSHACSRSVNRDPYAAMVDLGWRVVLVTVQGMHEGDRWIPSDPPEHPGIELHLLPCRGRHTRTLRFDGLLDLIEAEGPDWVVLDNDLHSLQAVQLGYHKRRVGYRLGILSCENQPFTAPALLRRRGVRGWLLGLGMAICRTWMRPRTDQLISINRAGVELFRRSGFPRVAWSPLGFPERYFHIDKDKAGALKGKLNLKAPVVAYFGRMVKEKGIHILLDALDRVIDRQWHFMLDDFQADTSYQKEIAQRVATAKWRDRTVRVHAKHGEVAAYMNSADIVVVPSMSTPTWSEQYGRVLPEALACGCQVLASDCGELPHLVPGAVLVHREGNSEELARQLRAALDSEPRSFDARKKQMELAVALGSRAQAEHWNRMLRAA